MSHKHQLERSEGGAGGPSAPCHGRVPVPPSVTFTREIGDDCSSAAGPLETNLHTIFSTVLKAYGIRLIYLAGDGLGAASTCTSPVTQNNAQHAHITHTQTLIARIIKT